MKKIRPKVQKYMTPSPRSIGYDRPLSQAIAVMSELRIRHLPVLKDGKLVGILSDRDVKLVASFEDIDPEKILVEEACTFDPYCVSSESDLNEAVNYMAKKKYGCAVVVDSGKLVGILTEVDVYKAFTDFLDNKL
ncbi:MAG: hypothetical protein B7Y39_01475 [Bdellovibrio sp. 28-41-41]|nr:MAG: hypothetical protein B7Y39_01475 [Bdellovibrio sp. 28-41-41]